MGTYYYFKCTDCNQYSDVIGKTFAGGELSLQQIPKLITFLQEHRGHNLVFGNEHQDIFTYRIRRST